MDNPTSSLQPPAPTGGASTASSAVPSRTGTPAGEKAIPVELPSNLPSANTSHVKLVEETAPDGSRRTVELHPVQPHERVTGEVIEDVRAGHGNGKLYVKKANPKPVYSLGHTKGGPVLPPIDHGNVIGIAHAFPQHQQRKKKGPGSVGGGTMSPSGSARQSLDVPRTSVESGRGGAGGAAALAATNAQEMAMLLEHLRRMIREEVQTANQGHAEELKAHTEDQLKAAVEEIAADQEETKENTKEDGLANGYVSTKDVDEDQPFPQQRRDGTEGAQLAVKHEMEDEQIEKQLDTASEDESDVFPNPWAKFRHTMREPFAEFLGTMILCIIGDGVNNQVILSTQLNADNPSNAKGSYLSISFGWGIATAMGIWSCGGISGGLINPSITIGLACYRGFPWKKVPVYIVAQILGGMVGALCIYGLYEVPIRQLDPMQTDTTASLFTTYPADFLRTPGTRMIEFYNEVLATAVLFIVVLAIGDANNTPPVDGMAPLVLLWLVTGIGATLGWQTAYAVNVARDLGPRLALYIVGYGPDVLWTFDAWYWLRTPILGTIVGALLGGFIYDMLIYTGSESWTNAKWQFSDIGFRRKKRGEIGSGSTGSRGPASFSGSSDDKA